MPLSRQSTLLLTQSRLLVLVATAGTVRSRTGATSAVTGSTAPCQKRHLSMCSWWASPEDRAREAEAYGPIHRLSVSNLQRLVQDREAWLRQAYYLIDEGERLIKKVCKYGDEISDIVRTLLDQEPAGSFGTVYLDRPELEDELRARVCDLLALDADPSHGEPLNLAQLHSLLSAGESESAAEEGEESEEGSADEESASDED
ncbi:hypothetical protein NLJ89_g12169 [Agrocybe chaxingu]|uniref:Uncharacterized protein n=1 Tax=Agrocybe chaxingu TaxID=84603 RepID=A0A9W8JR11_9AGAR|nr:hypothetical protein NLJ89_g12169 [Agrocybe chaxingu]